MQFQIRAVECLVTHFDYIFGTSVVLKSTDTVFDQSFNHVKLTRAQSNPVVVSGDEECELKHGKSVSFHDFDREFGNLKTRDEIALVKRNRRRQCVISSSLPVCSEGLGEDDEGVEPSNDTINASITF